MNSFSPLHLCALFSGSSRRVASTRTRAFLKMELVVNLQRLSRTTPLKVRDGHCTWFDDQHARLGEVRVACSDGAMIAEELEKEVPMKEADTSLKRRHAAVPAAL